MKSSQYKQTCKLIEKEIDRGKEPELVYLELVHPQIATDLQIPVHERMKSLSIEDYVNSTIYRVIPILPGENKNTIQSQKMKQIKVYGEIMQKEYGISTKQLVIDNLTKLETAEISLLFNRMNREQKIQDSLYEMRRELEQEEDMINEKLKTYDCMERTGVKTQIGNLPLDLKSESTKLQIRFALIEEHEKKSEEELQKLSVQLVAHSAYAIGRRVEALI